MTESRKASEVLLDLENKIDSLISLIKAQNFANQILSNKITDLVQSLSQQQTESPKITVEAVNVLPKVSTSPLHNFKPTDPERQIPIMAEARLPETNEPRGFRRTARPETFAGDDVYLDQQLLSPEQPKMPLQVSKAPPQGRGPGAEVIVPTKLTQPTQPQQSPKQQLPKQSIVQNAVPVVQRVVNGDGKSIFLADVEIVDISTSQPLSKTRTNGTGKWMASLGVGAYRVTILKKGSSITGEKMEAIQDIQVKGDVSPLELPVLILK